MHHSLESLIMPYNIKFDSSSYLYKMTFIQHGH